VCRTFHSGTLHEKTKHREEREEKGEKGENKTELQRELSSSWRGKSCGGMTPLSDTGVVLPPLRTLRAASEERTFYSCRNGKQSVGFGR
jgi:hypothetical protein